MALTRSYSTHQQKAILECIRRQNGCFTAAELEEALRESGEKVGVATLYRHLEKLETQGMVHRITTDEGACWQCCDAEDHDCFLLKCEHCGRIRHVDCEQLSPLYRHLEEEHHFSINPHKTMLYGLCESCREAHHV